MMVSWCIVAFLCSEPSNDLLFYWVSATANAVLLVRVQPLCHMVLEVASACSSLHIPYIHTTSYQQCSSPPPFPASFTLHDVTDGVLEKLEMENVEMIILLYSSHRFGE